MTVRTVHYHYFLFLFLTFGGANSFLLSNHVTSSNHRLSSSSSSSSKEAPQQLSSTKNKNGNHDGDNDCMISRRETLSWWMTSVIGGGAVATMSSSSFSSPAYAASTVRVDQWPSLEFLEPIYEFSLSVKAVKDGVGTESSRPYIQERLEKFFGGGLFSERNFYGGLGVQYTNEIRYSKSELNEYIKLDKEQRFNSMERTLLGMESLYKELQKPQGKFDYELAQSYADDAWMGIQAWLALVPQDQVQAVADLFTHARQADTNRNGKLEEDELSSLSPEEQRIWKKRISLAGG